MVTVAKPTPTKANNFNLAFEKDCDLCFMGRARNKWLSENTSSPCIFSSQEAKCSDEAPVYIVCSRHYI